MQIFFNSCIYLLAILGIIFTTITFFEMILQKKTISYGYRIFKGNNENNKKVDIVIHIQNLNKKEEDLLVEKILKKQDMNIKEIATSISIQKDK